MAKKPNLPLCIHIHSPMAWLAIMDGGRWTADREGWENGNL